MVLFTIATVWGIVKASPAAKSFFFEKSLASVTEMFIPQKELSIYNSLFEGFKTNAPQGYGVNEHYLVRNSCDNDKIVGWFHAHSNPDPMPIPNKEESKKWIISTRISSFPIGCV